MEEFSEREERAEEAMVQAIDVLVNELPPLEALAMMAAGCASLFDAMVEPEYVKELFIEMLSKTESNCDREPTDWDHHVKCRGE